MKFIMFVRLMVVAGAAALAIPWLRENIIGLSVPSSIFVVALHTVLDGILIALMWGAGVLALRCLNILRKESTHSAYYLYTLVTTPLYAFAVVQWAGVFGAWAAPVAAESWSSAAIFALLLTGMLAMVNEMLLTWTQALGEERKWDGYYIASDSLMQTPLRHWTKEVWLRNLLPLLTIAAVLTFVLPGIRGSTGVYHYILGLLLACAGLVVYYVIGLASIMLIAYLHIWRADKDSPQRLKLVLFALAPIVATAYLQILTWMGPEWQGISVDGWGSAIFSGVAVSTVGYLAYAIPAVCRDVHDYA